MRNSPTMTTIKSFQDLVQDMSKLPSGWNMSAVIYEDNMTYVLWNEKSREGIVIDAMKEDLDVLLKLCQSLQGMRWIVADTHTHADHISISHGLAKELNAPFIMHRLSPSERVQIRISQDTLIPLQAAPLQFFVTPGHTPDGLTISWGPFVAVGDTLLFDDVGRDDLPGGNPEIHFESVQKLKMKIQKSALFLPGHDSPGRVCSWETQCKSNPGLNQDRETFIRENGSYIGPAPKRLKESLFENFK